MAKRSGSTSRAGKSSGGRARKAKRRSAKRKRSANASGPESDARLSARQMAAQQRQISVSEFFLKNRHLLGFDSPQKALLTTVKEAVDNALDACEDAQIPPCVAVEVSQLDSDRYLVAVEDNGPGIVVEQITRIFGKLLYGSRFHELRQSRGQQGIGISAAGMYGQLTTGKPMRILTRTGNRARAWELVLGIDTSKNRPDLHKKRRIDWDVPHGTRVEIEMEGQYRTGQHSIDMYLKQTAVVNPHVTIRFSDPSGNVTVHERSVSHVPLRPRAIKPHPHGVELGALIAMLHASNKKHLFGFLTHEFSRVGKTTALRIIERAGGSLTRRSYTTRVAHAEAEALHAALSAIRIPAPRADCIAPIGDALLLEGLKKEVDADVYLTTTRPPAVYRGNPFVVEVGVAYGRPDQRLERAADGRIVEAKGEVAGLVAESGQPARLLRYANRVPLLFQQSACAVTRAVIGVNWKTYGLEQPKGGLPVAPMVILVHVASVWVPFTSESKEAIAAYPELLKEITLGLQECGRKLRSHIRETKQLRKEHDQRRFIEKYLPHVGAALQQILEMSDDERNAATARLEDILHETRNV